MNEDVLAKVKQAKSPKELLAFAAENGYTLDEEKAKEFFEKLQSLDELTEDELDTISGGRYEEIQEKIQLQHGGSRGKLQTLPIQWRTHGQAGGSEPIIMYDEDIR